MLHDEELLKRETLRRMIIRGGVDNYIGHGMRRTDSALYRIFDRVNLNTRLLNDAYYAKDSTRMVLVPLNGLPKDVLERAQPAGEFGPSGYAVCFTYKGIKIDFGGKRNGMFTGIAIMSAENAQKFSKMVQKDPRLLFSLARAINNGPIKKSNGEPAKIEAGSQVTIIPNIKLGGEVSRPIQSKPFPQNYEPNPLL